MGVSGLKHTDTEENIQSRLQQIANEMAEILPRLVGDPKDTLLGYLNGGAGNRETNWHDSKKLKELQAERDALLTQHKLRIV